MLPKTKQSWEEWINKLQETTIQTNFKEETYIKQLAEKLESTILKNVSNLNNLGLLFSGGIDSTLIAFILKKHKIPFKAISIGFFDGNKKFPEDITKAQIVAKQLNLDYYEVLLNTNEIEIIFKKLVKILSKEYSNVVNIGVGSVEYIAIQKLKKLNCENILGGLGSEEIFAGYERHEKSSDPQNECWIGLKQMFERDMIREFKIATNLNVNLITPFLDQELITFAMTIPAKYKINFEDKKIILRKSAIYLGLNEEFAKRVKKAAQYGSRTDKAIFFLAKKNNFKYKKDYILSLLK